MTQFVLANNVNTTLSTAAGSTATTLTLASSANLPTLSAGQIMPLTLNDAATGLSYEIVYVTAISGTTLTVTRAQENTGALNWSAGDYAYCAITAGTAATADGNPSNQFQVAAATQSGQAMQLGQANAVLLKTATVTSGVASIDFTGLGSDGYSQYIIEIDDLTPSGSNVELWMRFSVGGSFLSTAIYAYAWSYVNTTGVGGAQGNSATNQIQLLNGIISGTGLGTAGRIAVYSPHSTSAYKRIIWDMQNANNTQTTRYYGASSFTNLGSIDGIRLLMSSGNIATATVKLYGVN